MLIKKKSIKKSCVRLSKKLSTFVRPVQVDMKDIYEDISIKIFSLVKFQKFNRKNLRIHHLYHCMKCKKIHNYAGENKFFQINIIHHPTISNGLPTFPYVHIYFHF